MKAGSAEAMNKDDSGAANSDRVTNTIDAVDGRDLPSKIPGANTSEVQPSPVPKSQGWAFWSKEASGLNRDNVPTVAGGNLALAKSPSQSQPEIATFKGANGDLDRKVQSGESLQATSALRTVQKPSEPPKPNNGRQKSKSSDPSTSQGKQSTHNLLLPAFRSTYRPIEKPTLLQSLGRLWHNDNNSNTKSVELLPIPPKIKKAIAIVSDTPPLFNQ